MDFAISIFIVVAVAYAAYKATGELRRATHAAIGWAVFEGVSTLYDLAVWGYAEDMWGVWSWPHLYLGTLVIDLTMLYLYEKSGKDLLGVNALHDFEEESPGWIASIIKKGNIITYYFLMCYNPFLFCAYLKKGEREVSFTGKDFIRFSVSSVASFFTWALLVKLALGVMRLITYLYAII